MDRGSGGLVVGMRFNPTDLELVQHYLPRRIAVGDGFHADFIHECPGFFGEKPWAVWHKYDGGQCNREEDVKAIYVFTRRKRLSPNSTRFNRKVEGCGGTWRGQYPRPINNYDNIVVGKRREFQFRYDKGCDQNLTNTTWLMEEYEKAGDDSDVVLCALRKKPTPPPSHCSPAVSNTGVNKRKTSLDQPEPKKQNNSGSVDDNGTMSLPYDYANPAPDSVFTFTDIGGFIICLFSQVQAFEGGQKNKMFNIKSKTRVHW